MHAHARCCEDAPCSWSLHPAQKTADQMIRILPKAAPGMSPPYTILPHGGEPFGRIARPLLARVVGRGQQVPETGLGIETWPATWVTTSTWRAFISSAHCTCVCSTSLCLNLIASAAVLRKKTISRELFTTQDRQTIELRRRAVPLTAPCSEHAPVQPASADWQCKLGLAPCQSPEPHARLVNLTLASVRVVLAQAPSASLCMRQSSPKVSNPVRLPRAVTASSLLIDSKGSQGFSIDRRIRQRPRVLLRGYCLLFDP